MAAAHLHPKSPIEYQRMFYEQVGLPPVRSDGVGSVWAKSGVGTIRSFGSVDTVQTGVGDYVVPCDFVTHYDYEFAYLHFGIVTSGFTYAVWQDGDCGGKMRGHRDEDAGETGSLLAAPSSFVCVETSPVSAVRWTKGLRFKGTEISVSFEHLDTVVLPALGLASSDIAYLRPNTRFTHLPTELTNVLERAESLLVAGTYTLAMQEALVMEFVACLARPDVARAIVSGQGMRTERLRVGDRRVTVTGEDFRNVARAHAYIEENACEFPSIPALARRFGLSEQKFKAGFAHMYQMTVWEYANAVRMGEATDLLRETGKSVREVALACGYQSQAAFNTMFKRWSGMTPHRFRMRLREGA